LVAQEVKEVVKETVIVGDDENQTLGLNYSELIPVLIKGMQEQQKQIETQQKEIYELKSLVNTLVANQNGQGNK
jgi:soluble P-type ATPase